MAKFTLRIPTREQFAFIECTYDSTEISDPVSKYEELTSYVNRDRSLMDKEFNKVLDDYIYGTGPMTAEQYEAMTEGQRSIIQAIKRSKARKG